MSLSKVWTPPPVSLPMPPSVCVDVCKCVCLCVCVDWTRRWLSPIPSSVSLTGPSRRAARLFSPDGTTAQLTPPQPCQHNLRFWPTICSPDPDEEKDGRWSQNETRKKDNGEKEKKKQPYLFAYCIKRTVHLSLHHLLHDFFLYISLFGWLLLI